MSNFGNAYVHPDISKTAKAFSEAFATHRPQEHVTIYFESAGRPVRYKRVNKPLISKKKFGIWVCTDQIRDGQGYSPKDAYHAWVRNHFFRAKS